MKRLLLLLIALTWLIICSTSVFACTCAEYGTPVCAAYWRSDAVNGRFKFKVYGDFKYALEAKEWGERSGNSGRVSITDKSTNLTLVLKPE